MTVSTVIHKTKKLIITNKYTNWDKFREELDKQINLKIRFKTTRKLDSQTESFVEAIRNAARKLTPIPKNQLVQNICYPLEIRQMIKEKRRAKKIWQHSKYPEDNF